MAQRYCTNCGAELREDASFCGKCGRPVHETARAVVMAMDVLSTQLKSRLRQFSPSHL